MPRRSEPGTSVFKINEKVLAGLSEDQRAVAVEELKRLESLHKLNPLIGYRPHAKQREFHVPGPRSRLFLGGNRSGKTTCTMVDTCIQAIDTDMVPEHLRPFKIWEPPFYGRVVTPDLWNRLGSNRSSFSANAKGPVAAAMASMSLRRIRFELPLTRRTLVVAATGARPARREGLGLAI